jgi:PKD repeat protein
MKLSCKLACAALILVQTLAVHAGAIRYLPGFSANTYGVNDDGTFPCTGLDTGEPANCAGGVTLPIGFTINFYSNSFSALYLNNNGNITFDAPLSEFTPFGLAATATQVIAPFFADVDTRVGNVVTFGNDTVDGHPAFGVNWISVGYFDENTDKLNSFQLILIQRSDRNPGDFDIEFNYDQVQWETGDASDGVGGLGGSSAVVGFSNGSSRPGTSFELHGSGIPGQFLDSNPGGLIHRSLNSTVLGRYVIPIVNLTNTVLNVARFSQGDSRWAGNTYGNSSYTIQQMGCALSALAMALQYEGISTDPGALNTLMKNDNDFVGTGVNWSAATRDASGNALEFHAFRTTDTPFLSQSLANGHPVIVGVNLNDDGVPGHFVVVIGQRNGQFLINDPGHANRTTLDDYENDFETRGYVSDPPGDVSGLAVAVDNPAEVLVVDPLGRRAGYVAGTILEEIPQAFHFLDRIEDSDLTGAPGTDTAHLVDMYQPMQGVYQIFLNGTHSGNYKLTLRSFAANGSPGAPVTFQGAITSGTTRALQVYLGPSGLITQPFTNGCPWSASPTNGMPPLLVQFTAPGADAGGNPITQWNWVFGDGATSTEQNPSHIYNSGGVFFPNLAVINSAGTTVVGSGPAIVVPAVTFTASPKQGSPPLAVQFNCPGIDNLGLALMQWSWDFGDGSSSTEQNPLHTYTAAGSFSPSLTATNAAGSTVIGIGPKILAVPSLGLVLNGDFDTADLAGWTPSGNLGVSIDTDPLYVHSGTYGAELGPVGTLGFLSQAIPTIPGRSYLVSLWLDSPDGDTPNEFSVAWGGTTLFDGVNLPALGWTNLQFVVVASTSTTTLRLGFRDDPSYLGVDSIGVFPLQPVVASVSVSGRTLLLNAHNGLEGHTYSVLRSSNPSLPLNQWTSIATNVLNASGDFTFTLSNEVDPGTRRFYILRSQ